MFLSGALLLAALAFIVAPTRRRPPDPARPGAFPFASVALLAVLAIVGLTTWSRSSTLGETWGLGGSAGVTTWATYPMLHGGIVHLVGNLIALWLVAPAAESAVGAGRMVAVFFAASTAAGLVHLLLPASSSAGELVGASGAAFGLLGLCAVRHWRTRLTLGGMVAVPAAALIVVALGLQLALALGRPGDLTSYGAHLGGAVCGGLLAIPLRMREAGAAANLDESARHAESDGEWALAAAHYRELIRLRPDDLSLVLRLGRVSRNLGDLPGARSRALDALRRALQALDYANAADAFADVADLGNQGDLSAVELLAAAGACEAEHRPRLSETALATVSEREPGPDGDAARVRLARLYLLKLGRPDEAAALLDALIARDPPSPWADTARALRGNP